MNTLKKTIAITVTFVALTSTSYAAEVNPVQPATLGGSASVISGNYRGDEPADGFPSGCAKASFTAGQIGEYTWHGTGCDRFVDWTPKFVNGTFVQVGDEIVIEAVTWTLLEKSDDGSELVVKRSGGGWETDELILRRVGS